MNMKLCTASAIAYLVKDGPAPLRVLVASLIAGSHPGVKEHQVPGWVDMTMFQFTDNSFLIVGDESHMPDGGTFSCICALVSNTDVPMDLQSAHSAAQIEIWNAAQHSMMQRGAPAAVQNPPGFCARAWNGEPPSSACPCDDCRTRRAA